MVAQRRLSDHELFLLTVPSDTEESPWMTTPEFQWNIISLLHSILRLHADRHDRRWHLAGELLTTMPRPLGTRALDTGPDLLMAEADDVERTSWDVAREGPPALVVEVVTRESWLRDTVDKPEIYAGMGVREYVIFAPKRRRKAERFFGYHRDAAGQWGRWRPDARGELESAALGGLRLYVEGERLRVRDAAGRRLPSAAEAAEEAAARAREAAARAEQEAARAEQEALRAEREAARAEQEAAARRVAEAEVARLQALLQQRDEPGPH